MTRRAPTDEREAALVASISGLLPRLVKQVFMWRNNTGQLEVEERTVRFGRVGSSDFLGVVWNGRMFAVECKSPDGRLTHEQREFLTEVNRKGGYGCVVRSVPEFMAAVMKAGVGAVPPELEAARPPRLKKPKTPKKQAQTTTGREP